MSEHGTNRGYNHTRMLQHKYSTTQPHYNTNVKEPLHGITKKTSTIQHNVPTNQMHGTTSNVFLYPCVVSWLFCFVPCLFLFLTFVLYHVRFYFLLLFCTMFVFISYLCFVSCLFQTWYKTKVRNKNKHGTKQR
jgi:hypothetical protein